MSDHVIEADILSLWNVRLPIWWTAWRNIGEHQLLSDFGIFSEFLWPFSLADATNFDPNITFHSSLDNIPANLDLVDVMSHETVLSPSGKGNTTGIFEDLVLNKGGWVRAFYFFVFFIGNHFCTKNATGCFF